jgi:AraC-like DNA-binding protein
MHDLRVEELAHTFGFERSYLFRIFKARYGMSVKDYITKTRMENAKKLLMAGYTVCETAGLVGYEDEFNFSKAFKRYFGISPSRIRGDSKN